MFIRGHRIILRQIQPIDLEILWNWRNDPHFLQFCSVRRKSLGIGDFDKELGLDFLRDRHEQFLIYKKSDPNNPIGTIYSYSLNRVDGYVFVTIYLNKENARKGYGAVAVAVFFQYLFETFSLFKIYIEVYEYNVQSLNPLLKGGAVEEGRFRKHRLFDGKRWDLIRLAIYRDQLNSIRRITLDKVVVTE